MPDAPSSPLVHLQPGELLPAVRGLLQSFVSRGARCQVVGQDNRAMRSWLLGHGCQPVEVLASQATRLLFEGESFDAALLIGVLHQLVSPDLAALELRRVLRPGGVLLVTLTNLSYWRHRLDRATGATDRLAGGVSPSYLSGACCSRAASAWSGWRARTAPSCATCPSPAASAIAAVLAPTGSPSASSRPCSGRRSAPSPSGSDAGSGLRATGRKHRARVVIRDTCLEILDPVRLREHPE